MEALRVYGNLSLLEMAPVLLAAEQTYAGKTKLEHGSVMSLWGEASDLASLESAGQSDIAANSETQALRGSVAHPDLRFIFTLAECPYRIVARRSAGISKLADLRGKRIGTQLESSAQFFLDQMLRTADMTDSDVELAHFMAKTAKPIASLPEALKNGDIDAVALWEPQVERAKYLLASDAIEFYDPAVYTEKFCLCTTQAHLDDTHMRRDVVAFVRALIDATDRMKHEPTLAQQLVARTAGIDLELVRNAWQRFNYPGTLASDLLDVFARQEPWIAKVQKRAPRTREALATLVDRTVVRDAMTQ